MLEKNANRGVIAPVIILLLYTQQEYKKVSVSMPRLTTPFICFT